MASARDRIVLKNSLLQMDAKEEVSSYGLGARLIEAHAVLESLLRGDAYSSGKPEFFNGIDPKRMCRWAFREVYVRLLGLLALVMTTMGISWSASADQCKAVQGSQAISFQAIDAPVELKEGATIMDRPDGKAVLRVARDSTARASGVSKDGCWWVISLPNGDVGYVSANLAVLEE